MTPLDLNLNDEPYEIKMDDIELKAEVKERSKLNLGIIKKMDLRIIVVIIGIVVSFFGSFFNFWGLKVEGLGSLGCGNLFDGYGIGGVLGIIFLISIIVTFLLVYINLRKYAVFTVLVADLAFLIKVVVILIWGKNSFEGSGNTSVYFGAGFYICLIGIIITTYFTYFNYKKVIKPTIT